MGVRVRVADARRRVQRMISKEEALAIVGHNPLTLSGATSLQRYSQTIVALHERNAALEADLALAIKQQGELEAERDALKAFAEYTEAELARPHRPSEIRARAQFALHGTPAAAPEETE